MDKLYVLIRKDLSKSQQAVQGGHAVAKYVLRDQGLRWVNGTLVYLAVKNEDDLRHWEKKLKERGRMYVTFREPDIGYQRTALATVAGGELFLNERLL